MMPRLKDAWRRARLGWCGVRAEGVCSCESAGGSRDDWVFCPEGLSRASIVYSFGVGRHIGFDLWLIRRFGLTVHAFDPTPVSIEWVRSQRLPAEFVFHPVGLGTHDGTQRFFVPRSSGSAHFTSVARRDESAEEAIEAPVRRLGSLMRDLGHPHVDLLKMDIEGGEYGVLADICGSDVPASQILIEFHHNFPSVPMSRTVGALRSLRTRGFRVFNVSPRGLEISLRRAGNGA